MGGEGAGSSKERRSFGDWFKVAKERSRDTLWALLDQGAGLVASTLSFLLLGRTLGATGYGAFVGLYSLIGPFMAPSQAGVFLAVLEHVVRNGEDRVQVARSCLGIAVVNALLGVPVLCAVALHWIDGLPAIAGIVLIVTEFCLNATFSIFQALVQALVGYPAVVRLRLVSAVTRIALLAGLAVAGRLTLTTLAAGQALTLVGILVYFAKNDISTLLSTPVRPGRPQWRHARSVLLYGLGIGASSVQSDGDKFILNAAHHQADAGRYGAAYRLLSIVLLPPNALAGATHLSFLNSQPGKNVQLRRATRLSLVTLAYALPAIACMIFLAPLVPKILTKQFAETPVILQLLSPVVILRSVGVFPMNGVMGLGRNDIRTKLLLGNALISVVLYIALIPPYSWRGALIATLVSEVSLCASGWAALLICERRQPADAESSRPSRQASAAIP